MGGTRTGAPAVTGGGQQQTGGGFGGGWGTMPAWGGAGGPQGGLQGTNPGQTPPTGGYQGPMQTGMPVQFRPQAQENLSNPQKEQLATQYGGWGNVPYNAMPGQSPLSQPAQQQQTAGGGIQAPGQTGGYQGNPMPFQSGGGAQQPNQALQNYFQNFQPQAQANPTAGAPQYQQFQAPTAGQNANPYFGGYQAMGGAGGRR